jgi:hypothetical protein
VTAIDISEVFIAHAKQSEEQGPLGIDYRVASAVELPAEADPPPGKTNWLRYTGEAPRLRLERASDKNRRRPNSPRGHSMTSPREGEIARAGCWSRLGTCQNYFFSVSQQDIDRLKASILEQANPLHHGQPVPDAILIVRRIAEEAIIVAY